MKLKDDANCVSLINIVYLLIIYDIQSPDHLCNRFYLLFFGWARLEKIFFGSISKLEIIFWD